MKKITLALMCLMSVGMSYSQQTRTCGAMEELEHQKRLDPTLEQRMNEIEAFTQQKMERLSSQRIVNGEIITLPVVVHILYTNSTDNISMAQIESQIQILNQDFRRTNPDRDNKWSQAADTQIEFRLASVDPNGNATNGVTRTRVNSVDWGTKFKSRNAMKSASSGGVSPWNTSEYLNMWIVPKMTSSDNRTLLGFAQFPGGAASTDGVVMVHKYFGDIGTAEAPFDGGRTTTHEVGHFLNLRHIWGDSSDCRNDDFVADTPDSNEATGGCGEGKRTCGSLDMTENYMDYSNDSCMNLFTQGQKNRMRAVLEAGGTRRSLALSDKFGEGNDGGGTPPVADACNGGATLTGNTGSFADGSGSSDYDNNRDCSWLIRPENGGTVTLNFTSFDTEARYDFVAVYDGTSASATRVGNFSGGSIPSSITSSGNALFVRFTSDGSVTEGGFAASYTSNTSTGSQCTDVTVSIKLDNYPQETSWNITDRNSNEVVASGGTYGNRPDGSTVTVTECLDPGSYRFTILDSANDGLCCRYGNGSYTLTVGSESASGDSFGGSESVNFTINSSSRATEAVNTFGEVATTQAQIMSVYPNPASQNGVLNVTNYKGNATYSVIDMLGRAVLSGKLSNNRVDVSTLNSGMYILQLTSENGKTINDRFAIK